MVLVEYRLVCRSCMITDGVDHNYMVADGEESFYLEKSEFYMMNQVEFWRNEDNHLCHFCGSKNVEAYHIRVNGHSLFNPNKDNDPANPNAIFFLEIRKLSDGQTSVDINTNGREIFFEPVDTLLKITSEWVDKYSDRMISRDTGSFSICLSWKNVLIANEVRARVQRMRFSGFSQSELHVVLKHLLDKYSLNGR